MANLLDIRRRIKSVKNTQQITRAMKFVATAKLQKAQARVFAARPYARHMLTVVNRLTRRMEDLSHPLMRDTGDSKILLVVVTGDKGLCGAFNANILRASHAFMAERPDVAFALDTVGKKGYEHFKRRRYELEAWYVDELARVDLGLAHRVAEPVLESFIRGEYDRVFLIYNEFKSVIQQRIVVEQLLPIAELELGEEGEEPVGVDYLYDQPRGEICEDVFSRHALVQIYHALLESTAAEQGARMAAMESATKNAGEMIDRLVMFRNRVRQAAITKEIIEIVSGANAL
ncbi:MAG: ATP synthase F1 subunit gamma [Acidobacteria bacterium]|nr:ATP synthase F1 subunit gamma [Acidobacteriota bacterium]